MKLIEKNKKAKVAVIGAGVAGLTAAYRLYEKGIDVELFEARNRIGGRVFTIKVGGKIAELGGQNIADGGEAANLMRLIDEFGLECSECRLNLNSAYFENNNFYSVNELIKKKNFQPEKLRKQIDDLLRKSHNLQEILEGLMEERDLLYRVLSVKLAGYEGAMPDKLSLFYVETLFQMLLGGICSVHKGGEEENYIDIKTIKKGNSFLLEKMKEKMKDRVHLNKILQKVMKLKNGPFLLTFNNEIEIQADVVVLAIPCSVYEDICFAEDLLSKERLNAIKSIQYGKNAKILVPFSSFPSKDFGLIGKEVFTFFDNDKGILTLFYTEKSSLFSKDTILDAYCLARPMLEKGFANECPSFVLPLYAIDQSFLEYNQPVGYSWPNDPYAKGSYSYITSGQEKLYTTLCEARGESVKEIFAPVDHLYFAG